MLLGPWQPDAGARGYVEARLPLAGDLDMDFDMGLYMDLGLDLDVEFYRAWAPGVWCFGRNVIIRAVWSAG